MELVEGEVRRDPGQVLEPFDRPALELDQHVVGAVVGAVPDRGARPALDGVTGDAENLLPFNPLTGLFESFRDALLYGQAPAAWELLVPLGAAALLLCVFYPLYRSEQSQLAKLLG